MMNSSSAVEYKAYNEEEPLKIHSDTVGASLSMADSTMESDAAKHKRFQETGFVAAILSLTGILALSSVAAAAGAMFLQASIFIYVCFSCPIILAPVVVYQRSKLERNPTLRDVHNQLRDEVNDFAEQNNILSVEVSKMQRQQERMKAVEDRFQQICRREQRDVASMLHLVKQNACIQKEIKALQAADEVQAILATIMKADKNNNSFICEKELDEVMLRLRAIAGRKDPKFDEEAIRAAFKSAMTEQGAALLRVHSALQKQRKEMEEQKDIDGSKYNPIMVDDDEESNIIRQVLSEEAKRKTSQGGCCH
ncbi:hypothetical protein IV203_031919 [Nitzschia inconspicua]|uniref:Uncharacterized protein n=1 Tax=Nitzschia inconspicua TaxID=303405 RepID=A0A9K3Q326_9STRA|nr:hypothetical protein IV203_031919 [Nitzschia inconspicua]